MVRLWVGSGVRKVLGHGAGKVMPQMFQEGQRGQRRHASAPAVACALSCVSSAAVQIRPQLPENYEFSRGSEAGQRLGNRQVFESLLVALRLNQELRTTCNFQFHFSSA